MHEARRKASEQYELAARAHRTAAEHNEKGELQCGNPALGTSAGVLGSRLQAGKGSPHQIGGDREPLNVHSL